MKKLLITLALAAMAFSSVSAQGVLFGVKGGISGNWIPKTNINPDDRVLPNTGFYGGISGAFDISDQTFVQTEVLYARKGISTRGATFGNKYWRKIGYIQVPVMLGFKMADEDFRFMIGPEFGFCIGNKVYDSATIVSPASASDVKKFNMALAIQTSYLIYEGLGIDFKIDYAFTRTFTGNDNGRNLCVQLGVSYLFGY